MSWRRIDFASVKSLSRLFDSFFRSVLFVCPFFFVVVVVVFFTGHFSSVLSFLSCVAFDMILLFYTRSDIDPSLWAYMPLREFGSYPGVIYWAGVGLSFQGPSRRLLLHCPSFDVILYCMLLYSLFVCLK